ncbi:hypothetical protein [Dyadobacter fanqingshengii]|uniref:Uncharacterized protein n=1 Tax=Dyadobacter fanqingshengii TaxID=2906443 RepID=A0A9X1P6P3_9BACT|nr:hypothetical protein [Dyadobacter fanqingshengii]MCF0039909.1 hypothetical protein [Dyadobacter fanqingshengii]MCF2502590.1 hypothetical protein [Dyadobacter fanqingshengii]USJ38331.1 hypothetical protein NFI81_11230 [Dyadobacter fanqingshengii]
MATIKITSSEFIDRGVIKTHPTGSSYIYLSFTKRIAFAAACLVPMYSGLRKFSMPALLVGASALLERGP